jgi:acid phosphatase family membrane protein YuiD
MKRPMKDIPDNIFWLTMAAIVCALVVGVTVSICRYEKAKVEAFTKAGYTQKSLPSTVTVEWVKEESAK